MSTQLTSAPRRARSTWLATVINHPATLCAVMAVALLLLGFFEAALRS